MNYFIMDILGIVILREELNDTEMKNVSIVTAI